MALEPSWTLVDSAGVVHVVAGRSALSQMFGKNTKPTYNNMLELVGEGSRGVVGYLCKDGWRMLRELPWLQHKESKRIVPVVGSAAQFLQPACDGPAPADRLHFAPPAALLLEHGANVNSVQHSTLGPLVPLVPFQVPQPAGVAGVLGGAPAPFAPPPQ
ncbi:hypothetical protein EMIHUDRAFT_124741, partial [Emiliania huxleyi CCMP1516]|uniref:Uncharacterized protein n=2 Tax=Emiliania huxleyi TaxID=2903 RepID=A0A0D3IHT2_EMIH1